jgi:hypothetical protein
LKKILIGSLAIGLALTLSGCALLYPNWGTDQNPSTSMSPTPSAESPSPSESPSASASPKQGVAEVSLIELGIDQGTSSIFVVAEVVNTAENGGKCTITFKSGATSKSVTVKAEANATSTQCYPAYLPTVGMPKGKGNVTITYESAGYLGTSEAYVVTIP